MAFRMSEQAYLVLLSLAQEPRHGYGIVQAVTEISDDRVRLSASTLYGILDRLLEAGLTEASGEIVVDGRLRRYYRLTPDGLSALQEETARITGLAARARRVLGPGLAGRPALGGA